MFDVSLRRFKDQVGTPFARSMNWIPPWTVSILALVVGLFAAFMAFRGQYLWAFGFWLLNRVLDGLDGLIARLTNTQTDFGGYMDILIDFIVYAALPIGLVAGAVSSERYLALACLLASFYINSASWMYLSAVLEKRSPHSKETQTTVVMPAGIIGGFETILVYGIFLLFPAHITALFYIFAALVLITVVQRLIWAKRNLTWNLQPATESHDTQTQHPRSELYP